MEPKKKIIAVLAGRLLLRLEPDIDCGFWAFVDGRFDSTEENDVGGQYVLCSGDFLKIFEKEDRNKEIWSGVIRFEEGNDASGQRDVSFNDWFAWFEDNYPAELTLLEGRYID